MKYKTLNNLKFLLSYAWNYKKSLFILYLSNVIFTLVVCLSGILAPRMLFEELTGLRRVQAVFSAKPQD